MRQDLEDLVGHVTDLMDTMLTEFEQQLAQLGYMPEGKEAVKLKAPEKRAMTDVILPALREHAARELVPRLLRVIDAQLPRIHGDIIIRGCTAGDPKLPLSNPEKPMEWGVKIPFTRDVRNFIAQVDGECYVTLIAQRIPMDVEDVAKRNANLIKQPEDATKDDNPNQMTLDQAPAPEPEAVAEAPAAPDNVIPLVVQTETSWWLEPKYGAEPSLMGFEAAMRGTGPEANPFPQPVADAPAKSDDAWRSWGEGYDEGEAEIRKRGGDQMPDLPALIPWTCSGDGSHAPVGYTAPEGSHECPLCNAMTYATRVDAQAVEPAPEPVEAEPLPATSSDESVAPATEPEPRHEAKPKAKRKTGGGGK